MNMVKVQLILPSGHKDVLAFTDNVKTMLNYHVQSRKYQYHVRSGVALFPSMGNE